MSLPMITYFTIMVKKMDIATNVIHKIFLTKIPNKQQNNLIHPFSYIALHVTMMFKGPMTRTEKLLLTQYLDGVKFS